MLKRHFNLSENGTNLRTEILAGTTTFATMAYIIFVQPVVLGAAGMDAGAVFTSTCLITIVWNPVRRVSQHTAGRREQA